MLFSIVLAIATGLAMAAQTPTNTSLGFTVGSLQAGLTNFAVGLILCLLLMLAIGQGDISLALECPTWQLVGGAYGVVILISVIISTPKLGVALTMSMLMFGQLVAGMVIDQFGLAGAAVVPITPLRFIGCLVAAIGIYLIYKGTASSVCLESKKQTAYLFLPFCGAAIASLQPSTNAALGASIGLIEASCVNFATGTLILLALVLITSKGHPKSYKRAKAWQFTGGFYGAFAVFCMIVGSPGIGIGLWNVCSMLGQLVGGMTVDTLGLFTMSKRAINSKRIAGTGFILCGIAIVAIAKIL